MKKGIGGVLLGGGERRITIEEGMSPLMYNIMVVGVLYYWGSRGKRL